MKRAFLHRILLALMIIPAWNLILFSQSMRASTMKPALKETAPSAGKNFRIIVVYDNNPYKAGFWEP
jgi:hypothetical protein